MKRSSKAHPFNQHVDKTASCLWVYASHGKYSNEWTEAGSAHMKLREHKQTTSPESCLGARHQAKCSLFNEAYSLVGKTVIKIIIQTFI